MKKRFFLIVLTAILYNLSFPPFGFSFLAWVALAPYIYLVISEKNLKEVAIDALAAGVLIYLPLIYWVGYVTWFGVIVILIYLTVFLAVFSFAVYWIYNKNQGWYFVLLTPVVWSGLEAIKELGAISFPWGFLSYSQYDFLPILQTASLFGHYFIDLFIVFFSAIVAASIKKRQFFKNAFVVFGVIFIVAFLWGLWRIKFVKLLPEYKVGFVQGNIAQKDKWKASNKVSTMNKYIFFTKLLAQEQPKIIFWPETAIPFYLEYDRNYSEYLQGLSRDLNVALVVGAPSVQVFRVGRNYTERYYNTVFLIKNGKISARYDKIHLVPFGEYVPIFKGLISKIVYGIGDFSHGKKYTVFEVDGHRFSTLICFEELYSALVREFIKRGSKFIVFLTNDAWYGESNMPYLHNIVGAFRAAEFGVPVLRCANTGISAYFDPLGQLLYSSDIFVEDAKNFEVYRPLSTTFYTKYGFFIRHLLIFGAVAILIYGVYDYIKQRNVRGEYDA